MLQSKEDRFMELLEKNKYRILRLCRTYAQSIDNQQDLYQEIVIELWKSFDTIRDPTYTNTWFYRVALNVGMRFRRTQKSIKSRKTNSIDFIHSETTAQEDMEKQELRNQLYRCIAQLDEGDRAIVLLHLEGIGNQQIAKIIGISENYVAVKLKRIREKLRVCINW